MVIGYIFGITGSNHQRVSVCDITRPSRRDAFHHVAGDMAYGNGDDLESDHSLPIDSRLLPASIQRKIDLGSFVGCDDNDGRVGIRAGRVGKFV